MLFLKNLLTTIFKCNPTTNKYFGRKTTPEIPPRKKTSLPAMERKLAAARGVENVNDKTNKKRS